MSDHRTDEQADFSQRRQPQLHKLSQEHEDCLSFAARIAGIAAAEDEAALLEGIRQIQEYNEREMERHLQHEEQTILGPMIQRHPQHRELCITLGQEHGLLRTLVESITPETAREDLARFADLLRRHTLLEEERLFPLVESLFDERELEAVARHVPLQRQTPPPSVAPPPAAASAPAAWLDKVAAHVQHHGEAAGHIVLFPRFQPEHVERLAERLGLALFDFQREVMAPLEEAADRIELEQLTEALDTMAAKGGIVAHNVEALLCVKPEAERRAWLDAFLERSWPHTVLLPIALYQGEVAEEHPRVCDLELEHMPPAPPRHEAPERVKYDLSDS